LLQKEEFTRQITVITESLMNLSRPLNMLVLFVPFILFPPDAKYLKRFNDLIMLKQVFLNLNSWQEALRSRF
jgi:hypothetical protein